MKRSLMVVASVTLAACGSDGAETSVSELTTTVPAASSSIPHTQPLTSGPGELSTIPTSTVVPPTSSPVATAAQSTAAVTSLATTVAGPTSDVAVVYASSGGDYPWLPVGWWDGTDFGSVDWPAGDVALPAASSESVSLASVELPGGAVRDITDYRREQYSCIDSPGPASIVVDPGLPEDPEWYGLRALAVEGDWDIQPRSVDAVGLDSPEYQALGESLVPDNGISRPELGDVTQVLRSDLDGDGIEEVLFTFQHFEEPVFGSPGDFSMVIARYPKADGTVVDDVVFEHVVPDQPDMPAGDNGRVIAIADVNGDGVMEVAIGVEVWEGAAVMVHEFENGELHQVMSSGCGA